LESPSTHLVAHLTILLGEAHVGFAGFGCEAGSKEQKAQMRIAGGWFEKGREGTSLTFPFFVLVVYMVAGRE
jgi:anaphase-promoting complex subunit 5